jgi:hypothetical protein
MLGLLTGLLYRGESNLRSSRYFYCQVELQIFKTVRFCRGKKDSYGLKSNYTQLVPGQNLELIENTHLRQKEYGLPSILKIRTKHRTNDIAMFRCILKSKSKYQR